MKVYVAVGQDFHAQHAQEDFPIRDTHPSRVPLLYSHRVSELIQTTAPTDDPRCPRVSVRSPQHVRTAVAPGRHHSQTDSPARGSSTRCAQTTASAAIADREVLTTPAHASSSNPKSTEKPDKSSHHDPALHLPRCRFPFRQTTARCYASHPLCIRTVGGHRNLKTSSR